MNYIEIREEYDENEEAKLDGKLIGFYHINILIII